MYINHNPNFGTHNTSPRPGAIEYIVIHYVGALGGAEANVNYYNQPSTTNASADFYVGHEGEIWQYNPDPAARYCWAVGGRRQNTQGGSLYGIARNDNCVNIEMCVRSSTGNLVPNDPGWYLEDATLNSTVELTRYLMDYYGIDIDHVIRHYDCNGKVCPGIVGWNADSGSEDAWLDFKARVEELGKKDTVGGNVEVLVEDVVIEDRGLQATDLAPLSEAEVVEAIGGLFTEDQKKSGILACVSMAQFILESGYGHTELAQNANNCFGMKAYLSGNTWEGTTWDGVSIYTKETKEDDGNGNLYTITADFRKYPCVEDSITDHSAYLLGAMNGDQPRYAGLQGCKDYKTAIQIIKDGGYATSTIYVEALCRIVEKWDLTRFNYVEPEPIAEIYRVRKEWDDEASQIGAFIVLDNAIACADDNLGYKVYDWNGKTIYKGPIEPYMVKVSIDDLNIRKGPGTDYAVVGQTGVGVFTIVEEKSGTGSDGGWGRLLSGAGWISLDYATRV